MSSGIVVNNITTGKIGGLVFKVLYANLGYKTHVIIAFSIISMVLSSIVIIIVLAHFFFTNTRKSISFRLSASLALCSFIYGLVLVLISKDELTNRMSNLQIRSLYFLLLASLCSIIMNTCCIALHLHLTALSNNHKIANRISPFYELVSWTVAGIICQPMFYIFYQIKRIPPLNIIVVLEKSWSDLYRDITCIYCFYVLGLAYCAYVCIAVILRLLPIWARIKRFDNMAIPSGSWLRDFNDPEPQQHVDRASLPISFDAPRKPSLYSELLPAPAAASLDTRDEPVPSPLSACGKKPRVSLVGSPITVAFPTNSKKPLAKRRRVIRFAVIRIAAYILVPLCTNTMLPIYMFLKNPSYNLGYCTILMPAIGGLFNFVVFLMQPTLDPVRDKFFRWCKRVALRTGCRRGRRAGNPAVDKAGRVGLLRKISAWRYLSSSWQFLTIRDNDDKPAHTTAATGEHDNSAASSTLVHIRHQLPPLSLPSSRQQQHQHQQQQQPNNATIQFSSHRPNPMIFHPPPYDDYQPIYNHSPKPRTPPPYNML